MKPLKKLMLGMVLGIVVLMKPVAKAEVQSEDISALVATSITSGGTTYVGRYLSLWNLENLEGTKSTNGDLAMEIRRMDHTLRMMDYSELNAAHQNLKKLELELEALYKSDKKSSFFADDVRELSRKIKIAKDLRNDLTIQLLAKSEPLHLSYSQAQKRYHHNKISIQRMIRQGKTLGAFTAASGVVTVVAGILLADVTLNDSDLSEFIIEYFSSMSHDEMNQVSETVAQELLGQ